MCSVATVPLRLPGPGSRLGFSSGAPAEAIELIGPVTANRAPVHRRVTTEPRHSTGLIPSRQHKAKKELHIINRPLHPAAAVRHTVGRAAPAAVAALTAARAVPAAAAVLTVGREVHPAAVQADR